MGLNREMRFGIMGLLAFLFAINSNISVYLWDEEEEEMSASRILSGFEITNDCIEGMNAGPGWKAATGIVKIADVPEDAPKVLCFVNTIHQHHDGRVKAIRETWGRKCDKLLFLSDATNTTIGAVKIEGVMYDHDHLWEKHKASIEYVMENYGDEYEWFYKSDDDAFVVMENLKAYLASDEIKTQHEQGIPLELGHRLTLPQKRIDQYINSDQLFQEFKEAIDSELLIFNSGGPGYAMNKAFMEASIDQFDTCLADKPIPDDMAISFCSARFGVVPYDTRDPNGSDRFHVMNPAHVYNMVNDHDPTFWYFDYHKHQDEVKSEGESISSETIAFHYIDGNAFQYMQNQLYSCRKPTVFDQQSNSSVNIL